MVPTMLEKPPPEITLLSPFGDHFGDPGRPSVGSAHSARTQGCHADPIETLHARKVATQIRSHSRAPNATTPKSCSAPL